MTLSTDSGEEGWAFAWENLRVTVKRQNAPSTATTPSDVEDASHAFENSPKSQVLLNSISGRVAPGELMCVMGPSGSGKSTFLDVISGRFMKAANSTVEGSIHFGSKPMPVNTASPGLMAYVAQEDKGIIGGLTVKENLQYAADLRMPAEFSFIEKQHHVTRVLQQLGLSNQADTIVGHAFKKGISGGQKRRVSLGIEIITGPAVLLLDEITSGLDSTAAVKVIELVKKIAQANQMRVICTIHQPSAKLFALFDSVLFLAGGNVAYHGPVSKMPMWFAKQGYPCPVYESHTDYVLDLLNTDFMVDNSSSLDSSLDTVDSVQKPVGASSLRTILKGYLQTIHPALMEKIAEQKLKPCRPDAALFRTQPATVGIHHAWVLTSRSLLTTWRDPAAFWIRLCLTFLVSVLAGTVWWQQPHAIESARNIAGGCFLFVLAVCFDALTAITSVLQWRALFMHEHKNGVYAMIPFVASQMIAIIPFLLAQALIVSIPFYFMTGLRAAAGPFFYFVGLLFMSTLVTESMVLVLTWLIPHAVAANAGGVLMFGFLMMMSGCLILPDSLPEFWRAWAYHIGLFKYTNEGILLNEFIEGEPIPCLDITTPFCVDGYTTLDVLRASFNMHVTDAAMPFWALAAIWIAMTFVFYLCVAREGWTWKKPVAVFIGLGRRESRMPLEVAGPSSGFKALP
ncbi:P-loop containing nucleoside triphosphate hydrolase protein [Gaertneriomyces semiglobifer]|nr:P-loop containing nucleoside triphosphate hydrolase protein [Gaertneriomyces semiglobifer]